MKDKQSLSVTTWAAILTFILGAYNVYEASQGHTMLAKDGITMDSWQVGGVGLALIAIAFYLWRLGIDKRKKDKEKNLKIDV